VFLRFHVRESTRYAFRRIHGHTQQAYQIYLSPLFFQSTRSRSDFSDRMDSRRNFVKFRLITRISRDIVDCTRIARIATRTTTDRRFGTSTIVRRAKRWKRNAAEFEDDSNADSRIHVSAGERARLTSRHPIRRFIAIAIV